VGRGQECDSIVRLILCLWLWHISLLACATCRGVFPSASATFPASLPTPKQGVEWVVVGGGSLYAVYYMSVYFMPLTISLKFYACVWGPSR